MTPIGIGMIGCGNMGRAVAHEVAQQSDAVSIRAIFDPDAAAVTATRTLFGDEFAVADSTEALVNRDDVDWVMIASWNCFHAEQTIAAFAAGKHVFCQKPLATTLEDCLAMRDAWRRSGQQFVIGFNLRYAPHYRKVRELLDAGVIGDLVSFEFNETLDFNHGGFIMGDWRRNTRHAGSHLLEKCCHDIDIANWMTGSRASRVASFGGLDFFTADNASALERVGKTRSGRQGYQTWRDGATLNPFTVDKDILDNQVIVIEYENGARATLHLNSNTALPERRLYLCGTEGTLRADLYTGTIEYRRIGFGTETVRVDSGASDLHGGSDVVLAQELIATMQAGDAPSTTLDDGLDAALTCFAIDEAQASGQVVRLDEYWAKVDS